MYKPIPAYIGLRYIRARRREQYISFIALFSLLGMILGVAALIVVTAVMNGFEHELRSRILNFVPHVLVQPATGPLDDWETLAEKVRGMPGVAGVAPYIAGQGMLSGSGRMAPVQVNGIVPELQPAVSRLGDFMVQGRLASLRPGEFGVVLGELSARRFDVVPGDRISLVLPQVTVTPAGVFPRIKQLTVVGVFEVGAQLDSAEVFVHLEDAARLFSLGAGVQALQVASPEMLRAGELAAELNRALPSGVRAADWSERQGNLFQAVKMEKLMVGLMLSVIVAVAAFNIVSILTMLVVDKRADIAVLRTMGATPSQVMLAFMVHGITIGVAGIAIGVLLGVPLAINAGTIVAWFEQLLGVYLFDPGVYFITRLPSVLHWGDLAWTTGLAMALSLLATVYPAWRAANIEPAEVLRYE